VKFIAALAVALALSVTPALAGQKPQPARAGGARQVVVASVVSADAAGKKITVKDAVGAVSTLPVEGKGITMLEFLKAGDQVNLTCRTRKKGSDQTVLNIRLANAKTRIKKKV
jgi:hypothetical protein